MRAKSLVSAAVAGLLLTAALGPAPVSAQQMTLASDSSFMQTAASLALLQFKLAKLAEKRGSDAGVREFGKRMAADYSKANEELAVAAKQAAFPHPVLLRQHQFTLNRFLGTKGASFDRAYMAETVARQGDELELYRQESEDGRVLSLKDLASRRLPGLEQRQTLALETARLVGADVAASTGQARGRSGGK